MSFRDKTVLAVIPARGGSKSIPRKNLAQLAGHSLIAHAAQVCSALDWLDAAVLSTDDPEMADEGRAQGLSVPFLRPDALASDTASSVDMWRHAWTASEAALGQHFDLSVLLEPTSPLRRQEEITLALETLMDTDAPSVVTVSPTPAHFSPQKTLEIGPSGTLGYFHPEGERHARRQTIPQYFHRNGVAYAVRRETLLDQGQILAPGTRAVVIDRPLVNIDDPFEMELAEWLLTR